MSGRVPRRFLVFCAAAALLLLDAPGAGAVPLSFSVQGRLTNASGVNRNGGYALRFAIYAAPGGGPALWEHSFDDPGRVAVSNGNFQVLLGAAGQPSLEPVFDGSPRWLGITVLGGPDIAQAEAELVPRQQLVSVPYAIRAERAAFADASAAAGVPAGTVLPFAAETPPEGFLECDGSAVSRAAFAALFAVLGERFGRGDGATTFNLPDLRGNFARGWDHGAGRDPDASVRQAPAAGGAAGDRVGSFQDDLFESHTHTFTQLGGPGSVTQTQRNIGGVFVQTGAAGGNETRPKNLYFMYIIKF